MRQVGRSCSRVLAPGTDVRRRPPVADDGGAVVAVDGDAVGLCWDGQWLSGFSGFPLQVLHFSWKTTLANKVALSICSRADSDIAVNF